MDSPSNPIPAVRLVLAYDGTAFSGWQTQPRQRTVQGQLHRAVATMNGAPADIRGASRTDAGVHAQGQVAAFDPVRAIDARGWVRGLNCELPPDVSVRSADACPRGYDPRHDAAGKHYRYLVQRGETPDPLLRTRAWFVRHRLDLESMRRAGQFYVGTHDFAAYQGAYDYRHNTVRTLTNVGVSRAYLDRDDVFAIDVHGTAFLKQMVRILAGTLVEVGRGRFTEERLLRSLDPDAKRPAAGPTAPAHGLTLMGIELGRQSNRDRSQSACASFATRTRGARMASAPDAKPAPGPRC